MKKSKVIITIVSVLILLFLAVLPVYALDETTDSIIEESGANNLFESLDDNTKELLNEFGIDSVNTEQIFKVSPEKVVSSIINVISLNFSKVFKLFFNLLAILVFESVAQSIVNDEKSKLADITFTLLITTAATVPAINVITLASSHIITSAGFMISFIPVYAFLLSASGNITQAVSFNTILFTASQFILQFCQTVMMPLTGILISINIASAINPVLPLDSITKAVKKTVIILLTFVSTVFIGFLSLKGTIASDVDALTVRSIRTVSGAVIPFIGSSVADAYSSVLGSLKIINSSFGFMGIIIIFIINAPIIIELLMYFFTFYFASIVAQMLKCESSKLLENIASVLSVINTIVVFVSIVFTVSVGIMLKTRIN